MDDIPEIPLKTMMKARLEWLGQRQELLARNISNTETPGYQPRDLKPQSFKEMLGSTASHPAAPLGVQLTVTNAAHLTGSREAGGGAFRAEKQKSVYETAPDGNGVSIEEQMMKLNKTQIDYQTATDLMRQYGSMISTALDAGH